MRKNNNEPFDRKEFLKLTASIGIPIALMNLLTTTGSLVDTMMIAGLGEKTVGAVGICGQYARLMMTFMFGFSYGGAMFIAQYWGSRDEQGIDRTFGMMNVFMISITMLFTVLSGFFPSLVLKAYTDKTAIQEIGIAYLRIAGWSFPFMVLSMSLAVLLRSTEHVRIPLFASILSVASNIVLNWLLIYGKLGFPAMGVRGAAFATLIANFLNFAAICVMSAVTGVHSVFRIRAHFRWPKGKLSEYLKKCAPMILNEVAMGISAMIINIVLGRQSEEAIAAIAVFRTLEGFYIAFFRGFSSSASILVGKPVGAGEPEKAWRRAIRLVYMCAVCIFFVAAALFLLRRPIFTAMGLSGTSMEIADGILLIFSIVIVIRMSNWLHNDTFRAAGDAVYGTRLELIFMYLLVIPVVLLGGLALHWPFLLIFALCYADEPVRIVLMHRHMYSGRWVRPVTEEGKRAMPEFRAAHHIEGC